MGLGLLIVVIIILIIVVVVLVRNKQSPGPVPGGPKLYFSRFEWGGISIEFDSEGRFLMANVKAGKKLKATVRYKDQFGNPAPIQAGSAVFTSSDETVATVEAQPETSDADGKVFQSTAIVTSVGPVGASQINATADGDPGAEEAPVNASGAVNVVPGNAVTSEIEFEEVPDEPTV